MAWRFLTVSVSRGQNWGFTFLPSVFLKQEMALPNAFTPPLSMWLNTLIVNRSTCCYESWYVQHVAAKTQLRSAYGFVRIVWSLINFPKTMAWRSKRRTVVFKQTPKSCAQLALGSEGQVGPAHVVLLRDTCEYLRKSDKFFWGTVPVVQKLVHLDDRSISRTQSIIAQKTLTRQWLPRCALQSRF